MQLLKTFISIHRSVKVRPTKEFFLLLFGIIGLFVQAYMHNYNIVYIMMFFLVSVAGASTYFGMKNLHPLTLEFVSQERFFVGESAAFTLKLSNSASHSVYDLHISYKDAAYSIKSLKSESSKHIKLHTKFLKRGKAALGSVHIESLFPLIHERKFRDIALERELLIYAHPEGESLLHSLNIDEKESGDLSNFKGIYDFVQGESLSTIHWASLAKNELLMKRVFSYDEEQEELHFSYDALSGDSQSRLSQLTLWVLECEAYGFMFTLELGEKSFDSKEESIDVILGEIALF